MSKKSFQALLQKELTRREFIKHSIIMLLSLVGVGSFIQYLSRDNYRPSGTNASYGRSSFGGKGRKQLAL